MRPDIEKLRGLLNTFQHLADNCLARHAANPKYADEILHTAKTYEEMRELCSEGVELLADYEWLLRERDLRTSIVPKDAVYISKEHFNRLCQLAARHKYGRCDCFEAVQPPAVSENQRED